MKRLFTNIIVAASLSVLAGCPSSNKPPSTQPATLPAAAEMPLASDPLAPAPTTKPADVAVVYTFAHPPRKTAIDEQPAPVDPGQKEIQNFIPAGDPSPIFRPVVTLSIFQLSVPAGTLTKTEAFWKHADETAIDVATHDLLDRNGVRVAMASLKEFDYFMSVLDKNPVHSKPAIYAAPGSKTIEIIMKKGVGEQVIYHHDPDGNMPVRSYDDADNIICVEFQPAPRKPDCVRISLCPMVRGLRKRLVAVGANGVDEIERVSPEKFFDLNLKSDVPVDSFLIIAPSREARNSMSVGNAFLMHEGAAEMCEDVILIVPQAAKLKGDKPVEASIQRP